MTSLLQLKKCDGKRTIALVGELTIELVGELTIELGRELTMKERGAVAAEEKESQMLSG